MAKPRILKKNYEFDRVYRKGKHEHGAELSLFYFQRSDRGRSRFGVTVSRKIRGAVQRNRVKRVLRELYRANAFAIKDGYDIILTGRSAAEKGSYARLQKDLAKLLKKTRLLKPAASLAAATPPSSPRKTPSASLAPPARSKEDNRLPEASRLSTQASASPSSAALSGQSPTSDTLEPSSPVIEAPKSSTPRKNANLEKPGKESRGNNLERSGRE